MPEKYSYKINTMFRSEGLFRIGLENVGSYNL